MKARMKTVLCGSATVFAFTVLSSTVVFAAPSTDSNNIEDSVWSYRAVADVDTQVNIRANASTKSEIVGYLPKGASADLIEKGEKWSHIISNGVEGYIKNDYLAYGEDAEYLANVYGTQGVKVNWDGVNLFSSPDAAADILDSADNGSEYSLISEDGDWYQVQMDDVTVAYVPAEDAEETIITDRAVAISTADVNVSNADANTDTTDSVAQGYYDPNGWAGMQQAMARQIQTALTTMTAILRMHMQTAAMAMTARVQMILIPTIATVQMVFMMILLRTAFMQTTATMQIVLIPVMLIIQAILIQTVLMPVKLMSPTVHTAQTVLIPTTATAKIRQQMLPMIPQTTLTILQRQPEAKRLLPQQIPVI